MRCPECAGEAQQHAPSCRWGVDLAPRYHVVLNLLAVWVGTGDTSKLRDAQDRLCELTAWASAHEAARAAD